MPATNSSRDARMVPIAAEAAPTRRAGQERQAPSSIAIA